MADGKAIPFHVLVLLVDVHIVWRIGTISLIVCVIWMRAVILYKAVTIGLGGCGRFITNYMPCRYADVRLVQHVVALYIPIVNFRFHIMLQNIIVVSIDRAFFSDLQNGFVIRFFLVLFVSSCRNVL